jgi:outer membrane protein OmpA-like peptidoglycan-associated protein
LLTASAAAQDAEGCKDHPLLTRMPNFVIRRCPVTDFGDHGFLVGKGKEIKVEGRLSEFLYEANEGPQPSRLQVHRNFENAITRIGGSVVGRDDDGNLFLKLAKDGRELWIHVNAYIPSQYSLWIVEKGAMNQDVVANAAALASGIKAEGKIAVYGITFDTGKSDIKPESAATLVEIAKMLKEQPSLKLHVVGHTDNVANFDLNLKLSQGRAAAVVQALVSKYGIAAARLKPYGVGPVAPVASNDAESGRAKNRRVELVKQ